MKKTLILTLALTSAMALGGCGQTRQERTVNAALVGGAAGALIGGAATGRAGGALAGGLIGAAAGGIIGANAEPNRRCVRIRYDYDGNRYCARYARY
jgi:hypothetical protein